MTPQHRAAIGLWLSSGLFAFAFFSFIFWQGFNGLFFDHEPYSWKWYSTLVTTPLSLLMLVSLVAASVISFKRFVNGKNDKNMIDRIAQNMRKAK